MPPETDSPTIEPVLRPPPPELLGVSVWGGGALVIVGVVTTTVVTSCPEALVVATTELDTACGVLELGAAPAWVVAAVGCGEGDCSEVVGTAEVAAAAVVEGEESVVVPAFVVVGTAPLVSEGLAAAAALVSGASNPRIWIALRSPIGSCCDAKTGMAEATTARNNKGVAFFIIQSNPLAVRRMKKSLRMNVV